MEANNGSERLGKRQKPLRRSANGLHKRAIKIAPADGAVLIDAVHSGGRYLVRITPACDCSATCTCAEESRSLTSEPPIA